MIEFFFRILEHFCPLFVHIAQMGLILPRWGLILIPPPTPLLYSAVTGPFLDMCIHKKNRTPPQTTPFPGLNWNVGKMNYQMRPKLGNKFEK